MINFGYKNSNSDHTLFLKRQNNRITCLIIYVDDMIITGDDKEEIHILKQQLSHEFEMNDLGQQKYFLGVEVLRSKKRIFISQRKCILDLLATAGMIDCKLAETPIVTNHGLQMIEGEKLADRGQYQRLVGTLIYLSHTRPDTACVVGVVSRFMHQLQIHHMTAVTRILRCLKGTSNRGIIFRKNDHLDLLSYIDADQAGDRDSRRQKIYHWVLHFTWWNLVTWKSKKQKVVPLSSAEAEFRGIAKGITEIIWLQKLLKELQLPQKKTCKLFCDNKATINISENPVQHDRTKHVEIRRHLIKEKLEKKIISPPFVRSKDQLADMLTKVVTSETFEQTLCKFGIGDPKT